VTTRRTTNGAIGLLAAVSGLVLAGGPPATAAFPGDNGQIAFQSERGVGGGDDIYVMNADGSAPVNRSNDGSAGLPAWSPDGSKIAFKSDRDGNNEIYVMNADGSNQVNLTKASSSSERDPAWSPDGSKIAFRSDRDGGNQEIYSMNADGSGQVNLTNNNAAFDADPVWSPDGSKIAFRSGASGDQVYVMNANGSGQVNLSSNAFRDEDPAWSPDGSKIAFASYRDDASTSEIYVMNANGSSPTRLTNNSVFDYEPVWSPDGAKIAFTSRQSGFSDDIYVMNADGSDQVDRSNNSAPDFSPDWQPVPRIVPILPGPDKVAPSVLSLGFVKSTMRAAGKGGSIARAPVGARARYRLSEAATARFTVERAESGRKRGRKCVAPSRKLRRARRCTRYLRSKGSFARKSTMGLNAFRFTARLRGRKLGPGRYRLVLVATDAAGNKSKARRAAFRVVRR
jgi:Tol biopolymer transport system component